ncbi:hypothetical protein SASPL_106746 [Salvia splendens]|uniref:BRO1 domain-containing protein n=1 Tax=Salvia splendens TaxID=180675 RepID=A0A8X8YRZ4_SALSN|nr:uncharacterized protein LOC121770485 [Salvia splendens]XP_042023146.1 uncharacterized protein LOC121770485 [Salvia splendens]KAG6435095.1 hypothetical protein SASPL_106746 [Salvia splendens]
MGCTNSVYKKKKKIVPEISIFAPILRIPIHSDLQRILRGFVPNDLADRIAAIRNQIALVGEDTGGSAVSELIRALEEYLPLLLGLTKKEYGLQELVEFRWRELGEEREDICGTNSWFELLCVVHMMAMLTLMEANEKLIPKESSLPERLVSADCMRDAVDLLLKAAGYLNFCVLDVLPRLPHELKSRLPSDMQDNVLEAISHQALAQGTELQLGLAGLSKNATLSVKRRLACEQLSFYAQAHCCLSEKNESNTVLKKQLFFLKWKHLEAKAAAYYYHSLILDKGTEPSCHLSAVCCVLAAEELLVESKKACLTFCLAEPITRCPPPWGAMKHLQKKIPETAAKKTQMYTYLLDQEKGLKSLPELPEFQLSLKPDEYELPEADPLWDCPEQTLKKHLNHDDKETKT